MMKTYTLPLIGLMATTILATAVLDLALAPSAVAAPASAQIQGATGSNLLVTPMLPGQGEQFRITMAVNRADLTVLKFALTSNAASDGKAPCPWAQGVCRTATTANVKAVFNSTTGMYTYTVNDDNFADVTNPMAIKGNKCKYVLTFPAETFYDPDTIHSGTLTVSGCLIYKDKNATKAAAMTTVSQPIWFGSSAMKPGTGLVGQ